MLRYGKVLDCQKLPGEILPSIRKNVRESHSPEIVSAKLCFAIVTRSGDNDTSEVLDFIRCGIGTTVALEIRGESLERRSKVKKICILTVAIVFTWLTVASAQVWVDPYTRKDGTYVGGPYRSRPYGNPYNNRSYPGKVNPYTGKPAAANPNRYLEQYQNRNNFRSHSPNQYQLNPYQRRW